MAGKLESQMNKTGLTSPQLSLLTLNVFGPNNCYKYKPHVKMSLEILKRHEMIEIQNMFKYDSYY